MSMSDENFQIHQIFLLSMGMDEMQNSLPDQHRSFLSFIDARGSSSLCQTRDQTFLTTPFGQWAIVVKYFFLLAPPVITSPSTSKMKLLEDDELNVSCDTQGNPSPSTLWYRREKNDLKILAYSRLQIKNVKRSDAGNYSCMASNIIATVEKSLTLEVLGRS